MAQAKSGDKVKVHYHGKLVNGETFDTSEGREPLEFELGSGMVIKGFDDGVTGMQVGELKTIQIPVDQAYGQPSAEMIFDVPKENFPPDMVLEVGMPLMMNDQAGNQLPVNVIEIKENSVQLDANHPLAGQDLVFTLELVEIVGASKIILP